MCRDLSSEAGPGYRVWDGRGQNPVLVKGLAVAARGEARGVLMRVPAVMAVLASGLGATRAAAWAEARGLWSAVPLGQWRS